jgi:HEAT repeat protein
VKASSWELVSLDFDHGRIREHEDRRWTLALLDQLGAARAPEAEREEAARSLSHLEDYRSIAPLTAMVEDMRLPEPVREAASRALWGFDDTTTGGRRRHWWQSGDRVLMAHALRLMERSEADIVAAVAGDDEHPLQSLALGSMAFGYDEARFQPVKVQALRHPDAKVREAAADVLVWDEAVMAEEALVRAAVDPSPDVAAEAVDTLQYYASRRVLRLLAEMREVEDDHVRAKVKDSFDFLRGCFQDAATYGSAEDAVALRRWMAPVADLVQWPEEVQARKAGSPASPPARNVVPEETLLAMFGEADGEWWPKKQTLYKVDWQAYGPDERRRLAARFTAHPDPVVRSVTARALGEWSMTEELLELTDDPSATVRKSAMYSLRFVRKDPVVARRAWQFVCTTCGTAAHEALQTYVLHARPEQARDRLAGLASADPRDNVRTTAVACLVDLRASHEVEALAPLLLDPPSVSWALHIALLDAVQKLGLTAPPVGHLASVDNLWVARSARPFASLGPE